MKLLDASCVQTSNNKKFTVKEKRSSFTLNNPQQRQVSKIEIDGCLINDQSIKKCDYAFLHFQPKAQTHFVELKGKDIKKAIEQLKSTLTLLDEYKTKNGSKLKNTQKRCYIVSTRVPRTGTKPQALIKQFYKETKATLFIKNLQCSMTID